VKQDPVALLLKLEVVQQDIVVGGGAGRELGGTRRANGGYKIPGRGGRPPCWLLGLRHLDWPTSPSPAMASALSVLREENRFQLDIQ